MPLSPGARLGPYEIVSPLGTGGMGEVYRARDTRLGREVALKVLPADLSRDVERLRRFEQEARAASALNHPNIVVVHDVGQSGSISFIAMERVEGRSLRELMAPGPLPVRRILPLATQIAEGLTRAHAGGIVHRDLKPENLMVSEDGFVKILDFGLAKLSPPLDEKLTTAPTEAVEAPRTQSGMVLGTVGYMSPEQASGNEVDYRSDQFSFGSILYEMASGRRAFQGNSAAQTLAAIIEDEPELVASLKPDVPAPFIWVIERCLAKGPAERYESTRDLARDLANLRDRLTRASVAGIAAGKPSRRSTLKSAVTWALAGFLVAGGVSSILVRRAARRPGSKSVIRFPVAAPEGTSFQSGEILTKTAISPDGRSLALVAFEGGRSRLYLRPLDSVTPLEVTGTEGAQSPFWSPDGRFISFVAEGKLKKVDTVGGPPQTLCDVSFEGTGSWSRSGDILFAEAAPGREGIHRISAEGGERTRVAAPDAARKERFLFWPHFLPDGRHFFYLTVGFQSGTTHELRIGSLDSKETSSLGRIDSRAEYAPPGFLLFVRDGTLLARPFEVGSRRWAGEARQIVDRLHYFYGPATAGFSSSQNGVLAYEQGGVRSRLVWLGRDGREISTVASLEEVDDLRLSPAGERVAVSVRDPRTGTSDIWIYDLSRNIPTRLTSEPSHESKAVWAPDGSRIVFRSDQSGPPDLYEMPSAGGVVKSFLERPAGQMPQDFSSDGSVFLYSQGDRTTGQDVWLLPLSGARNPVPLLRTRFDEDEPRFSPDRKWIAYDSNESGGSEVYVAKGDGSGERIRVSTDGGFSPRWRRDGTELFYLAPGRRVMTISVKTGAAFHAGNPVELFRVEPAIFDYDIAPDGHRFLVSEAATPAGPPITVIVNWPRLLGEKPAPAP
jgi:eukaryotic-like serine/threonine-protein kinase